MSDDFKSPDDGLTEWDSSKATLMRVDYDLRKCAEFAMMKNYLAWHTTLKILKREAMVKMKSCGKQCYIGSHEKDCQIEACENLFTELEKQMKLYVQNYYKNPMADLHVERQLDRTELFIRDFMDKKGMLLRNSKDAMARFRGL